MKVRIKFSKTGAMKFIGHLDTMRFFQKAIRRADIPVAYSEGFSPHMIMSFAAPLGVGTTSSGEYFDMQLAKDMPTKELVRRMNTAMVEGIEVLSAVRVEDGKASKAMSLVAAADYEVTFREGICPRLGKQAGRILASARASCLQKDKTERKNRRYQTIYLSVSDSEKQAVS